MLPFHTNIFLTNKQNVILSLLKAVLENQQKISESLSSVVQQQYEQKKLSSDPQLADKTKNTVASILVKNPLLYSIAMLTDKSTIVAHVYGAAPQIADRLKMLPKVCVLLNPKVVFLFLLISSVSLHPKLQIDKEVKDLWRVQRNKFVNHVWIVAQKLARAHAICVHNHDPTASAYTAPIGENGVQLAPGKSLEERAWLKNLARRSTGGSTGDLCETAFVLQLITIAKEASRSFLNSHKGVPCGNYPFTRVLNSMFYVDFTHPCFISDHYTHMVHDQKEFINVNVHQELGVAVETIVFCWMVLLTKTGSLVADTVDIDNAAEDAEDHVPALERMTLDTTASVRRYFALLKHMHKLRSNKDVAPGLSQLSHSDKHNTALAFERFATAPELNKLTLLRRSAADAAEEGGDLLRPSAAATDTPDETIPDRPVQDSWAVVPGIDELNEISPPLELVPPIVPNAPAKHLFWWVNYGVDPRIRAGHSAIQRMAHGDGVSVAQV